MTETKWIDWHPKVGDVRPKRYRVRYKDEITWRYGLDAGEEMSQWSIDTFVYQIPAPEESVMKYWCPKYEPVVNGLTLADVPSSRESPVLCWRVDGGLIAPMWVHDHCVWRVDRDGMVAQCNGEARDVIVYGKENPDQTYTLETLPIGRVIRVDNNECWKDASGCWFAKDSVGRIDTATVNKPPHWTVTDYIMELKEVSCGKA